MSIAQRPPTTAPLATTTLQPRIRKGQRLDQLRQAEEQQAASSSSSSSSSSSPSSSSTSAQKLGSIATSSASSSSSTSTLAAIDSPFQLQEYLALLVRRDPHDVERIVAIPPDSNIDAASAPSSTLSSPRSRGTNGLGGGGGGIDDDAAGQPVDPDVWVYEQLRRVVLDLSTPWITTLQHECDRHAKPQSCGAMNAGDWMFLCASHGEEKQCCAIDYMVHTLDGATSLLNSARHFPSRTYVPSTSLRHFGAITRRLSRIFTHAWCYHRDTFEACEAETSLYSRFYHLVETYDLSSTDNLPPRPVAGGSSKGASSPRNGRRSGDGDDNLDVSRHSLPSLSLDGGNRSSGGGAGAGTQTTASAAAAGTNGKKASGAIVAAGLKSPTLGRKGKSPRSMAHLRGLGTAPPTSAVSASTTLDIVSGAGVGELSRREGEGEGDELGLIPPPAPSPRPTSIPSRPELDDEEERGVEQQQQQEQGGEVEVDDASLSEAELKRRNSAASTKTAIFVGSGGGEGGDEGKGEEEEAANAPVEEGVETVNGGKEETEEKAGNGEESAATASQVVKEGEESGKKDEEVATTAAA